MAPPAAIAEQPIETHIDRLDEHLGSHPTSSPPPENRTWWKEASVYQIYPASFKDSNGDGIGDIPGIISKLDYIKNLGADVVWLGPIYKSPQIDMGYDIADYRDIDPQYGTLENTQQLIEELHKRGMKLVMDLVVNHSSSEHDWFQQSKSSKTSPYRNWYHWHPGRIVDGNRVPPNNWLSYFGGSAWEWDEATQEYYLHIFAKEQPDLNWENPDVVEAVHDIMRFWLDRGVDGFRMDVINFISKVPGYPDASISNKDLDAIYQDGSEHFANGPRLHEFLKGLGAILKKYNAFSVGEMPGIKDPSEILKGVSFEREELNMIFHFELMEIDHGPGGKFSHKKLSLPKLKAITEKWQKFMYENSGWNALYLENHDQSRTVSRFCSDAPEHRVPSAKMLAAYLGFQAGTPYIYQGQELGVINVPKEWAMSEYKDIECVNHWKEVLARYKDPKVLEEYRRQYQIKGRDNARTPMQWSNSPHAGFTDPQVKPWMSANPSYESINAASQVDDGDSPYSFWKRILELRKQHADIFVYGNFDLLEGATDDNEILGYMRTYRNEAAVVLCNWTSQKVERSKALLGSPGDDGWDVLVSSNASFDSSMRKITFQPWGSLVLLRR
ncbi:Alpha-glucosidase [Drechslerella dactyloides]|uniref:Alpha-glucosidase n=1 Tax=Drechslerella dactyloides TaxID=74499 RepID=A0AAD6NKM5_DREDA|nr:Alpha-glucosidase [Drechslerella dactyloides]